MAESDALLNLLDNIPRPRVPQFPSRPYGGDGKSAVGTIATGVDDRNDSAMSVYEETVECIAESISVLRKLDIQMRKLMSQPQPVISETVPVIIDEPEPQVHEETHLLDVACVEKISEPDYSYYLKTYHVGYTGIAVLSHIASHLGSFVYLLDVHLGAHNDIALNVTECQPITQLPPNGSVFGVHLDDDGYVFRAVRASSATGPTDTIAAYLMDTGETVNIIIDQQDSSSQLYALPEQQQSIPAQAIPCRVVRVQHTASELSEFVLKHLYEKVRFEVAEIHADNSIDVCLSPIASTNPFLDMIDEQRPATSPNTDSEPNNAIVRYQRQQLSDPVGIEEGTSNAMIAVTGYNPQDDARICRHYDPNTGGCFKGAQCRFEHVAKLADGWTRDQTTTVAEQCVGQKWPHIGETVRCVPTHITSVNSFYAHILFELGPAAHQRLTELTRNMNSAETLAALRRFEQRPPNACDLVLARFRDPLWHRARVLDVVEESDGVRVTDVRLDVCFVDYGNCQQVRLDDVRQWEMRFSYVPFQAYEFRIGNVERVKAHADRRSLEAMRDLMLNQTLMAKVLHNTDVLVVTLQDSHGLDIGEQICNMGLAQLAFGADQKDN